MGLNSFDSDFDARLPLSHRLLRAVGSLREFRGQEALFIRQRPEVLQALRRTAIIASTESSNRIEGIAPPRKRLVEIVEGQAPNGDRSEQEVAGYRDVLNTIHEHHRGIPFNVNIVLQFHRDLFRYTAAGGGHWKVSQNEITETLPDGSRWQRFLPVAPHLTDQAMRDLHESFDRNWQAQQIDPLLLIPAYVFDFLCIHPFGDGNGRMARLLTLLLFYRAGFEVGRYISLERIIEKTKEEYYRTLELSSAGWHNGEHSLAPWTEYFLGMLTAAYRKFEERVGKVSGKRGFKRDMVLAAIESRAASFTIREIAERCSIVGIDHIRQVLNAARREGRLEVVGHGKAARWRKTGL
ncbi:MAG: Fic family protein [Calditrichaeota bacterium]|nr:Fic family protein [Calditrichota bacterium]